MAAYSLMIKTNHYLIRGGELTDVQQVKIARELRASRITDGRERTFDAYAYPKFYFPPHNNGKKLQTVIPISPGTNIVADNAYEFEILRLLHLFQPDDETVHMIDTTAKRLKHTCFGYKSCHYAECFEAGMMVLRFLSFAVTDDRDWMQKQITMFNDHFGDRRRHSGVQRYYWLILSDMPFDIAEPEILRRKETILDHINRGYAAKKGDEDILLCVMRNTLARLPEYAHIKKYKPYINEKTGKWHFNMNLTSEVMPHD